ncbi:hypothetical protein [Paenibacillus alvei]|nr:hypothetical protein [Paenibacillus alvei]
MSDNRIGILFSARMLREFISGKLKFESTHLYEEAARIVRTRSLLFPN